LTPSTLNANGKVLLPGLDLEQKLGSLESALDTIELAVPDMESSLRTMLRSRFEEVMGDLVDESRILAELASYLAKHTINEEIVRLRSHIAAFRMTMDEPLCGKKLDFICQEMNREANTIGSKSADVRISGAVISMKDAVENIREQARNIESNSTTADAVKASIIAISGKSGCGNSTVSRLVSERLGRRLVNYTFHTMAEELGIPFVKLLEMASADANYDRTLDERQVAMAHER